MIDPPTHQESLTNVHLYGKSKLGEDILITMILDRQESKTQVDCVVKAKDKGIVALICQRLHEIKVEDESEQ